MAIAAAAIAGGAILGSGIMSSSGQASANKQNLQIAREQMRFQERMSSTAYQRSSKDLELAGLNRILALGSSASTPAGASARMENVKAPLARAISQIPGTAMQMQKTAAEIKVLDANTKNLDSRTLLTDTQQLIASHGEVVAGATADIIRTVQAMTGNMTPEQTAAFIKAQIQKAIPVVTDYFEKIGNTSKETKGNIDRAVEAMQSFILDNVSPGRNYNPNLDENTYQNEYDRRRKMGYSHDAAKRAAKDLTTKWKK